MKNLKSFTKAYKDTYDEMTDAAPEAWYWLRCFILLFFLPVVWPLCCVVCKVRGD